MSKFVKGILGVLAGAAIFVMALYFLLLAFNKREQSKQIAAGLHKIRKGINEGTNPEKYRGFWRAPNSILNYKVLDGDKVIYDQTYYHDQYLMRVPEPDFSRASKHAIFGGCSFTWGEGVRSEDTLPWNFQINAPEYHSYNLGMPGAGVKELIRYTDFFDWKKVLKEEEGIYVYVFINHHLDRFHARYNYLGWVNYRVPHYEVENGKVVYKGIIGEQQVYKEFQAAKKAGIENTLINTQDPSKWSDKELSDFVIAVKELKRRYLDQVPKGKFFVLLHPHGAGLPEIQRLKHMLLPEIPVIDGDNLARSISKKTEEISNMKIPKDNHPNGELNHYLARWLVNQVKTAGQNQR